MAGESLPHGAPARVDLPGVPPELREEIEGRIGEFERQHGPDLVRDGPGWVPRVRGADYAVAGLVTAGLVVWLAVVLLTA